MVTLRWNWLLKAGLLAAVVIGLVCWRWPRPEKEIRKRFERLATWVSKDPGEPASVMAYKTQRLGELFAETCVLEVDRYGLAGTYTPTEISSHAARARPMLSRLTLTFHDLRIRFTRSTVAEAVFTARVVGASDNGGAMEETAEIGAQVRKIEGKWLFCHFREVPVLRK